MLGALLVFCVATLVCAAAPSIEALIGARAVQAFGAAGAIVLARAVVRDLYDGARAGRELSVMAMIMGLAPIVAPVIGSLLQSAFGWRACFVFIFAGGLVAAAAVRWLLPETLRPRLHQPITLWGSLVSVGVVIRNRVALAYVAMIAAAYGGLFAFISASSFVLQNVHGLSPLGFGVSFAIASVGYVFGTSLAARLVTRWGIDRTIGLGAGALALGGLAMVIATALAPDAVGGIVLPMMIYLFGLGLAMPQALARRVAAVSGTRRGRLLGDRLRPAIDRRDQRRAGGPRARRHRMASGGRHRDRRRHHAGDLGVDARRAAARRQRARARLRRRRACHGGAILASLSYDETVNRFPGSTERDVLR